MLNKRLKSTYFKVTKPFLQLFHHYLWFVRYGSVITIIDHESEDTSNLPSGDEEERLPMGVL